MEEINQKRLRLFDDEKKINKINILSKIIIFFSNRIWILCYFLISLIPAIFISDQLVKVLSLLLPTFGYINIRMDFVFGIIVSFFISFIVLLFLPLTHKVLNFGKILIFLLLMFIIIFFLAIIIHPYNSGNNKLINNQTHQKELMLFIFIQVNLLFQIIY
jgi:hypothetical protein